MNPTPRIASAWGLLELNVNGGGESWEVGVGWASKPPGSCRAYAAGWPDPPLPVGRRDGLPLDVFAVLVTIRSILSTIRMVDVCKTSDVLPLSPG